MDKSRPKNYLLFFKDHNEKWCSCCQDIDEYSMETYDSFYNIMIKFFPTSLMDWRDKFYKYHHSTIGIDLVDPETSEVLAYWEVFYDGFNLQRHRKDLKYFHSIILDTDVMWEIYIDNDRFFGSLEEAKREIRRDYIIQEIDTKTKEITKLYKELDMLYKEEKE